MLSNKIKRCFSLFMAIFMLISLMPASAFAAGEEDHDHSHENIEQAADNTNESAGTELPTEDVPPATVNPAIAEYQAEIDRILTEYFGGTQLTAEEIQSTVDAMDDDTCIVVYEEIYILEDNILWAYDNGLLSDEDWATLYNANITMQYVVQEVAPRAEAALPPISLFKSTTLGSLGVNETANRDITVSEKNLTFSVRASLWGTANNTVTLTNNLDEKAILTLKYEFSGCTSYNIDGASVAASGTKSWELEDEATVKFNFSRKASGMGGETAYLYLKDVALVSANASYKFTYNFDSTLGSVKMDGNSVTSGSAVEPSLDGGVSEAIPNSGVSFVAWVDGSTNTLLSQSKTYNVPVDADKTIRAIFTKDTPYFLHKETNKVYDTLNAAVAAAGNSGTILPLNNGTLPAGDYTIPSGVTLLIPYDNAYTTYTTQPASDSYGYVIGGTNAAYIAPTVFRKLTLASGAHITVNGTGSISLPAMMHAASGGKTNAGAPTGPCSYMHMNDGSSITLNNTSNLYAYGFITGKGTITANSGTTVYECFQFEDFRGGTQTTDNTMKTNRVFPLSQYYVQNIEATLTIYAGAKVKCPTNVYMQNTSVQFTASFIGGSESMFQIDSGSVTKRYDPATDRLILEGAGVFSCSPTKMTISTTSIDSADFVLPLNSNISLLIRNGSEATISQDIALLPGTEIVVEKGAKITLAEGTEIYAFDADQWDVYCYSSNKDVKFAALPYAPGRTYTRTAADLVDAKILVDGEIDASKGGIYTTAGGANVYTNGTGKITYKDGTAATIKQLKQASKTYDAIDVTAAQLKNGDGTYTDTSTAAAGSTFEYCTEHDVWYTGECAKCAEASHVCKDNATHHAKADSTCIATGTIEYWSCSKCSKNYSDEACTVEVSDDDLTIAMKSHSYTGDWSNTETQHGKLCVNGCNKAGDYENHSYENACDTTCNDGCGYTRTTSHTPGAAATCVTAQTCTECGATIQDALGHAFNSKASASVVSEATCTANKVVHVQCDRCTEIDTANTVEVENTKLTHSYEATFTWAADYTCTVKINCKTCKTINVVGNAVVDEDTTQPSCYQDGQTVYSASYIYEGKTYTASETRTEVLDATNQHNFSQDYTTENGMHWQACTTSGCPAKQNKAGCSGATVYTHVDGTKTHTAVSTCGVCEKVISNQTLECADSDDEDTLCDSCGFDLHVHNFVQRGTLVDSGNCQTEATYKGECACGAESDTETVKGVKDPKTHTGKTVVSDATDATCTVPGYTGDTHCADCGVKLKEGNTINALGHAYSAWVVTKNATCTEAGSKQKTCANCGDKVIEEISKLDPVYGDPTWVFTKIENGATAVATFTCSTCGGDAESHSVSVEATAVSEVEGTVPPTCTAEGSVQYTATAVREGQTYTGTSEPYTLDKLSHDKSFTGAKAATCVAQGNQAYWYCASCEIFYEDEACTKAYGKDKHILPIDLDNGHAYGTEWKTDETNHWHECANGCKIKGSEDAHEWAPATFDAPKTCGVCGATEGAALTALAQIKKADGSTIVNYVSFNDALQAAVEGDTIVLLDDAVSSRGFYPIELPTNGTLDLNGKTFTGTAAGRIAMNRGTLKTYADDGKTIYTMAGPADAKYITTDAVFVLGIDWSMTVESGTAELGAPWQTLPNQKVTIGKGAVVSIPEDMTFTIRGEVIVAGTLTCYGTIELGNVNASLTAPEGLKVTLAEGLGDCALYVDGKYVAHTHAYEAVVTAPTCTEAGYTTYTCSVCGDDYTDDEVAATGHGYENDCDTTCNVCGAIRTVGDHQYANDCDADCNECGATREAPHTPGEAVEENRIESTTTEAGHYDSVVYCTACGEEISRETIELPMVEITLNPFGGMSMSLGNSLAANFRIYTNQLPSSGNVAMITRVGENGEMDTVEIPQSAWTKINSSSSYFTYTDLFARQMSDTFRITIYNNGNPITVEYEDSVRDYATRMISTTEAKADSVQKRNDLALYVELLNYGAAAQKNFNYKTDDLANKDLSNEQLAYGLGDIAGENKQVLGTGYRDGSLSLTEEILLNFRFNNSAIANAVRAEATYTNHRGVEMKKTFTKNDFLPATSTTSYVSVDGMAFADGNQLITVTFYDADNNPVASAADTVVSYAERSRNKSELYVAVIRFVQAAYNTFHD